MGISAVIITKNEEDNLERCLKSLKFCDEIVVVDSQSTDLTKEIAEKYTKNVYDEAWLGFEAQRTLALSYATHDWILSIDADEEVSEELKNEILKQAVSPSEFSAFSLPRKTIHFGRWIKHGGWYPNRLIRLFKKADGEWKGDAVHEFWSTKGKVGEIKADLLHYSFSSLADQVDRNNKYSSLGAEKLSTKETRFSLFKLLAKPVSKFLETYLLKLGLLDGYPGFIISVSAAYSVFLKWAKLWELERVEKA